MEDFCVPVYIFGDNGGLLASGDGWIRQEKGRYYGSFEFDDVHIKSDVIEVSFPLCLVYGADGTSCPIGDVIFTRSVAEFRGMLEFKDDDFLHQIMPNARSVTNVDWFK